MYSKNTSKISEEAENQNFSQYMTPLPQLPIDLPYFYKPCPQLKKIESVQPEAVTKEPIPPSNISKSFDFNRLPIEMITHICRFLDGESLLNFLMTEPLGHIVEVAMSGNTGLKIWFDLCINEIDKSIFLGILSSYQRFNLKELPLSTINREFYMQKRTPKLDISVPENSLGLNNWSDVYYHYSSIKHLLTEEIVTVDELFDLESKIKSETRIAIPKDYRKNTLLILTTCSGLLLHAKYPCTSHEDQQHFFVYENFSELRREVQLISRRSKIYGVDTTFVQRSDAIHDWIQKSNLPIQFLPKVDPVAIISTSSKILAYPLFKGEMDQIFMKEYDQSPPMHKRFACFRNIIATWSELSLLNFYRITFDLFGNIEFKHLLTIDLGNLLRDYWILFSKNPNLFQPVLEEIKPNNDEYNAYKELLSVSEDNSEVDEILPVFTIHSPIHEQLSVYGSLVEITPKDTANFASARLAREKARVSPVKAYGEMPLEVEGEIIGSKVFYSENSSSGFDTTCFFWTPNMLIRVDKIPIFVKSLKKFIRSYWIYQPLKKKLQNKEELQYFDGLTSNLVVFGTNLSIRILEITVNRAKLIADRHVKVKLPKSGKEVLRLEEAYLLGSLSFEFLRIIPLIDIYGPLYNDLKFFNLKFDYEDGKPIIFAVLDRKEEASKSNFTFQLLKIGFGEI